MIYTLIFHDMQFNAPPRLTASNAGMPTISQSGRALLICSNAWSSSGIPSCQCVAMSGYTQYTMFFY